MTMKLNLAVLFILVSNSCMAQNVDDYLAVIEQQGEQPVQFVQQKLETHDLLIFDDAIHSAKEPFDFFAELIKHPDTRLDFVFVEVLNTDVQSKINAFLDSTPKNTDLLIEVFQDDYSGFGWRYETYLDLLSAVWEHNHARESEDKKIHVIGVNQPIYWEAIHDRRDFDDFISTLDVRDYFLYLKILKSLDSFSSGKKGIFLTNTRHSYKNIRKSNGEPYWNTGTFFYRWHPGKTYSVRFHNVLLFFESQVKKEKTTAQGLDQVTYRWIKPENGIWEEAFELNDNRPVAIPLENNVFGRAKYVGNHMLNVAEGQTMHDAYDALVFLAPLDELHFSARMNFFYTEEFKQELKRRIRVMHGDDLESYLKDNDAESLDDFIDEVTRYIPVSENRLSAP